MQDLQDYPQRIRLQRRLHGIHLVFLKLTVPMQTCFFLFTKELSAHKLTSKRSPKCKKTDKTNSVLSSLESHPSLVTLDMITFTECIEGLH